MNKSLKIKLCICCFLLSIQIVFSQDKKFTNRFELLSGVRRPKDAQANWDQRYNKQQYIYGKTPADFLSENYKYIPDSSNVLDMGMGEGRNAVFLAGKGYKVIGVDISPIAVKKAQALAREFGVRIKAVVSSMEDYKISKNSLDAIICFYFVDRSLRKKIIDWLRPGGILIYEAHNKLQKTVPGSENYDDRFLLEKGELLTMFKGMKVLKYEEPMHKPEFISSIILQKPSGKK